FSYAPFHGRSLLADQPIALVQLMACDRDRIAEYHRDGTGAEEGEPLWLQHFARARDSDRHAIETARQRRHRRPLLERQHLVGRRARPFGEEEESHSAEALLEPRADRLRRPVRVAAVDEDVSHPLGSPAEERNLPQLALGHDGGNVHVRGVVGDEDVALAGIERGRLRDDAGAGAEQHEAAPGAQHAVGERTVAGDPDERRRDENADDDEGNPDSGAEDPSDHRSGSRAAGYSSAAGKRSTSAIDAVPVRSMRSRSRPMATPPAAGMSPSAS